MVHLACSSQGWLGGVEFLSAPHQTYDPAATKSESLINLPQLFFSSHQPQRQLIPKERITKVWLRLYLEVNGGMKGRESSWIFSARISRYAHAALEEIMPGTPLSPTASATISTSCLQVNYLSYPCCAAVPIATRTVVGFRNALAGCLSRSVGC